ncbi:ANTAR domain-containing protein [Nocardia cyriacigeorgica]|uniref:PAS and ANTAR domain-containing protein n=1 Tax=Nocardia cyriacigeorgica TaxID=135487 RepID=UPI0013BC6BE0|nr:PAS and ANTAR domain-containing protein [Nocardia cyriacigeorgica]NEW52405.1 ANTAR domain-containing protein [Nocardia cyriacigeorgica]
MTDDGPVSACDLEADGAQPVGEALGTGSAQHVGGFRFWFADERWEWSDEVARMHGYRPGTVVPTTALLLGHKHPDDRDYVADVLAHAIAEAEPFSSRHRIIDTTGETHHVIVVADTMADAGGAVVGTAGYYIDVTDTLAEHRKEALDDTLPELLTARAVIEQAKGVLMLVYGLTAEQAFRVLTWRSQETNVKVRSLAGRLIAELPTLRNTPARMRSEFDHLLLTVHQRVRE